MLWSIEDLDQNIYERICHRLNLDSTDDASLIVVRNMSVDDAFKHYCDSMGWDHEQCVAVVEAFNDIFLAGERIED